MANEEGESEKHGNKGIDLFLLFVSLESCSLDDLQGIVGRGRWKKIEG
jgi:hypothetical protein